MKIGCACGNTIHDNTGFLPYKAYLIPDQDLEDILEAQTATPSGPFRPLGLPYAAEIYQCPACGRLMIFRDSDTAVSFALEEGGDSQDSKNILRSYKGEKWRGLLRGSWLNGKASLWWYTNGSAEEDNGYLTDFSSWGEMESRYRRLFKRLKSAGQLRSAMLVRDEKNVHSWSFDPNALDI